MNATNVSWDQDLNTWTTTTGNNTYYWTTWPGSGTTWVPQIRGGAEDPPSEDAGQDDGDPEDDTDATGSDKPDEEEQKFTQEDLNKVVAKEVDKAKRGKLDPKDLGFDSRKELETFVTSMKEKSEEEKSEAEKEREAAIQQAKDEATKGVLDQSKKLVLKAEFKLMAQEAGIAPEAREDAFVISQTLEDWSNVEVSDEGEVSGLDKDFFETLKKEKPYLFAQPAEEEGDTTPANVGQRAGGKAKSNEDSGLKAKYPALRGPNEAWRWQS